jgi:beta-fructofuranosidase
MENLLKKARRTEAETLNAIESDEQEKNQRPKFHFASPSGWVNDPNGFSFFNGECHLFFQYNPYETKWNTMHWGHATTKDFVHWSFSGAALAPDSPWDKDGCYSGSAIQENETHIIAYTGVVKENGKEFQQQCIAAGDGKNYRKFEENPVITARDIPFSFQENHFRDPKLWKENGQFFLAAVVKKTDGCGAIVLFKSADLISWQFVSVVDKSQDGLSGMWECPDYFKLDGRDVLIFSPQEMKENKSYGFHDGNNSVYMTGELDKSSFTFKRETRIENGLTAAEIDGGLDFYAPQTVLSPDGRRIMIAWMQSWESFITPEDYLWSGMMTFPRKLFFVDEKLFQLPVDEIKKFRGEKKSGRIVLSDGKKSDLDGIKSRHFDATFRIKFADKKGKLIFKFAKGKKYFVSLEMDAENSLLSFSRKSSQERGTIFSRSMNISLPENEIVELRILMDTCSLEVFANGGESAFTNAFFVPSDSDEIWLETEKDSEVEYEFFEIQS